MSTPWRWSPEILFFTPICTDCRLSLSVDRNDTRQPNANGPFQKQDPSDNMNHKHHSHEPQAPQVAVEHCAIQQGLPHANMQSSKCMKTISKVLETEGMMSKSPTRAHCRMYYHATSFKSLRHTLMEVCVTRVSSTTSSSTTCSL